MLDGRRKSVEPMLLANIAVSVLDEHFAAKWQALGPDWSSDRNAMGEFGLIPWRAGCAETGTSGSAGGPRRRAGRKKAGTAPRPDPYTYVRTRQGWA